MTEVIAELERCLSGGTPTVVFERSGSSATNVAASGASGSGNELQDFLRQISGGEPATATSGKTSGTVVTPSSAEAETMISSADGAGTDPRTDQTLTLERMRPSRPQAAGKSATTAKIVFGVIGVLVLGVALVLATKGRAKAPPGDLAESSGNAAHRSDQRDAVRGAPSTKGGKSTTATTTEVTGRFSLLFDGEHDHVEVPTLRLDGLNEFTIEARVRPAIRPGRKGSILAGLSDPVFAVDVNEEGRLSGYLMRGRQPRAVFGPHFVDGSWHEIAATVSGTKIELFVDGRPQPVDAPPYDIVPENVSIPRDHFLIGAGQAWDVRQLIYPFQGEIDELRVSRTIRHRGEYAPSDRLTPDNDTLALYHFDEGTGTELKDSSDNNHHGKIVGAKWVKVSAKSAPPSAIAPFETKQARTHQEAWAKHLGVPVEYENSIGMKFVLIPPGEFLMGSTDQQVAAALRVANAFKAESGVIDRIEKAERPQHKVVITKPLLMSATEVTIKHFKKFAAATSYQTEAERDEMALKAAPPDPNQPPRKPIPTYLNPGDPVTDDSPASVITWSDAAAYCLWLSDQEQQTYRLPTETEWEYACRAGTTTLYSYGDDANTVPKYGWYRQNSVGKSHPVGTLLPNPFGLFDMHGNLWEWCSDYWDEKWYEKTSPTDPVGPSDGSPRVLRGGNWQSDAASCRSASRFNSLPSLRHGHYGFRVVCELSVPAATSVTPVSPPVVTPTPKPAPVGPQPPPAKAPFDAKQALKHQEAWAKHLGTMVETTNSVGAKMILIPPGEFLMGSTPEQIAAAKKMAEDEKMFQQDYYWTRHLEEAPQHRVTITQPFWVGRTEVTVAQFRKFVESSKYVTEAEKYGAGNTSETTLSEKVKDADKGLNWKSPGYVSSDDAPVTQVTWNDACAYCVWLSEQEKRTPWYQSDGQGGWKLAAQGNGYRLPTEAEWEYACRAGTTTMFSFGDEVSLLSQYGWHLKNLDGKAQPVAVKLPNPFGLYDVHGNVWEWCHDLFNRETYAQSPPRDPVGSSITGTYRVLRGGYWTYHAAYCRSAYRGSNPPTTRSNHDGFRVVRGGE